MGIIVERLTRWPLFLICNEALSEHLSEDEPGLISMYMCSNGDITEIEKGLILEYRCLLTKPNSRGTLIGERECFYWDGGAKSSQYAKILAKFPLKERRTWLEIISKLAVDVTTMLLLLIPTK